MVVLWPVLPPVRRGSGVPPHGRGRWVWIGATWLAAALYLLLGALVMAVLSLVFRMGQPRARASVNRIRAALVVVAHWRPRHGVVKAADPR